uniref:Uncharacterized protein n=1 Tax=Physcomitrium patens TaxID=3218 RepID=A0A7I4BES7_PHYPA
MFPRECEGVSVDPRCFIDLKFRGDVQNLVAMAPVSVTCLTRFSQSCCPQSQGLWKRISVGFLCSSVMVMSSGWASAVEAVQASPLSDYVVAVFTLTGALGILQFFDELAKRDFLEKTLSRKLCHILSGLVFMLFWPLFSTAPLAKYLAAFALVANGFRMIGLGLGLWKNESLVKAISRGGSRRVPFIMQLQSWSQHFFSGEIHLLAYVQLQLCAQAMGLRILWAESMVS